MIIIGIEQNQSIRMVIRDGPEAMLNRVALLGLRIDFFKERAESLERITFHSGMSERFKDDLAHSSVKELQVDRKCGILVRAEQGDEQLCQIVLDHGPLDGYR